MYLSISPSFTQTHTHTHTHTHTRYLTHSHTLSLSQRAAGEHGTTLVDSFQAAVQLITLYSSSPPTSSSSGAAMSTVGHNNQPSVQSRQQVCLLYFLSYTCSFCCLCARFLTSFSCFIFPAFSCPVLSCPILSCFFVYHLLFPVF
jgi:hypothetical protein